jgi:multidrug efflux system membrane fusion protein
MCRCMRVDWPAANTSVACTARRCTGTVIAYLPTSSQTTQGVAIPANAIVWYGGQPWSYVQMAANRFGRYPVPEQFPMNGGFFAKRGFKPGERVVTSGAQLLLSEELRPQAGSSACKDPECD